MKKRIAVWCAVLTAWAVLLAAVPVYGDVQPVDPQHPSSITLQYGVPDVEIRIYRVAEAAADGTYTLCGAFRNYPVNIYGVTTQAEWKTIADTLAAYAAADEVAPTAVQVTDASGTVRFSGLLPGLYLTQAVQVKTQTGVRTYGRFLTAVPAQDADGGLRYDVTATPKYEFRDTQPDWVQYKVVKQWKDGGSAARPRSILVEIYKDGELQTKQTLSSANNWSYRWTAPADGASWQVVERSVPSGYTVATTVKDTTIVITNTRQTDEPPKPPKTGGTFAPEPYILAMCAAGAVLLVIAARRKRVNG